MRKNVLWKIGMSEHCEERFSVVLRLASSRDKEGILKLAPNGIECQSPEDIAKNTYTLEFLDISEQEKVTVQTPHH